jgi:hypothetical protein
VQPPRSPDLDLSYFYLLGYLKYTAYLAAIENEEALGPVIFMPVRPFTTASGLLKGCGSFLSDVSMCALIQLVDILSICCELRLGKNKKSKIMQFGISLTFRGPCQGDALFLKFV